MNDLAITIDVDWAPDFMIDFVAIMLEAHGVRSTWFVTHDSPALTRLRRRPELFELGIHPNFLPGSTHGDTVAAALLHCMKLVPDAASVRTHGLFQSTALLAEIMRQPSIELDASLFLPRAPGLRPVEYEWGQRTLLRIPYFWEDDFEMERAEPCWRLEPLTSAGPGLKVFDFHPAHVYLNSRSMDAYHLLKQRAPELPTAGPEQCDGLVQSGTGTRTLFSELVAHLSDTGESTCMRDIHEKWRRSRAGPGSKG